MSYVKTPAFQITPGHAFEAFVPGTRSPMLPQALYRPGAAGPRSLVGLDGHQYYAPLRQMRLPLRGLGEDLFAQMLTGAQPQINTAVAAVLNSAWPQIEARMQPTLRPIKIMLGLGLAASVVAAIFSVLSYKQRA